MLAQTPLPGYIDVASRTFRFTGGGLANVAFVSYSLLEFETVNLADASLEETASRYLAMRESPLSNLLPAPPPSLGDRAIAFTADGDDPNFVVKVAIMAVRDGPRIHFLIGSQLNQSPIPIMEEVALQGLLPVEEPLPGELTVTGLNSGGLWDTIPRPEDLPEGFSVDDELVPKMFGPFAKSPMSTAPSASPSPTGDPEEIA